MAYIRKRPRVLKAVPDCPGKVLFRDAAGGEGFLVWWKFTTKRPPRPKRGWVTLVVFMEDHELRRRSYRLTWNGERFARGEIVSLLQARHPEVLEQVEARLGEYRARLVRPPE